jgi:hypothetical protein
MKAKNENDTILKKKVIYDTFEKIGIVTSNDTKYKNLYIEIPT